MDYYITKRIGHRNGAPVLYLPKDWGIIPDVDVTFEDMLKRWTLNNDI